MILTTSPKTLSSIAHKQIFETRDLTSWGYFSPAILIRISAWIPGLYSRSSWLATRLRSTFLASGTPACRSCRSKSSTTTALAKDGTTNPSLTLSRCWTEPRRTGRSWSARKSRRPDKRWVWSRFRNQAKNVDVGFAAKKSCPEMEFRLIPIFNFAFRCVSWQNSCFSGEKCPFFNLWEILVYWNYTLPEVVTFCWTVIYWWTFREVFFEQFSFCPLKPKELSRAKFSHMLVFKQ